MEELDFTVALIARSSLMALDLTLPNDLEGPISPVYRLTPLPNPYRGEVRVSASTLSSQSSLLVSPALLDRISAMMFYSPLHYMLTIAGKFLFLNNVNDEDNISS